MKDYFCTYQSTIGVDRIVCMVNHLKGRYPNCPYVTKADMLKDESPCEDYKEGDGYVYPLH